MKECWLSPYGEIIYTNGEWEHASKAAKILFERYNNGKWEYIEEVWCEWKTPTDLLEDLGWIRYSTITHSWIFGNSSKLTTDQKNKMFDLTGYVSE